MPSAHVKELNERLQESIRKYSRLKKSSLIGGSDDEAHLWSMIDLLTLLLIFFVIFYSHSSSTNITAGNTEKLNIMPPPEEELLGMPSPQDTTLKRLLGQAEQNKNFAIRYDENRIVFILGEQITFALGEAELRSNFIPELDGIAAYIIENPEPRVIVSGHTDNLPINNARFASNWELSAARSLTVTRYLISRGVDPFQISSAAYGEFDPLLPNSSAQNRQANRRVEIELIKDQD